MISATTVVDRPSFCVRGIVGLLGWVMLLWFVIANAYAIAPDVSASITIGGPAVTVTTTESGQNASLTFSGTAGQQISLNVTAISSSLSCPTFSIVNPDGTNLLAPTLTCGSSFFMDVKTLPATGIYTIVMNPRDAGTGSATFTLFEVPPDATGTIAIGGTALTMTTTVPGQNASLTFSGTAGQRISLNVTAISLGCVTFTIVNPDGLNLLTPTGSCGASFFTDVKILPATGTYTIVLNPSGATTGSATFTLYEVPPDATGTLAIGGPALTMTTTVPGQNASLTFSGTAGQRISLNVTAISFGCPTFTIVNPDGTNLLAPTGSCGASFFTDVKILPATGTYTIVLNPSGATIGSATFIVYEVPPDATGTLAIGGPALTMTTTIPGQNARVTFSGTAGQRISLNVTAISFGCPTFTIVNPDGTNLLTPTGSCGSSFFTDVKILPATGTYTIVLNPSGTTTGSATFIVYEVPPDATGTLAIGGPALTMTTTIPGQNARLTFSGTAGQQISLNVTAISFGCPTFTIVNPDGTNLLAPSGSCGSSFSSGVKTTPVTGTYTIVLDPSGATTGSATFTLNNASTNIPTVALTAPAADAIIGTNTVISATATDTLGIARVDFYVDDVLLGSVANAPYSANWNISGVANGTHTIKAVATNTVQRTATDTRNVTVSKIAPIITSLQFANTALTGGMTITNAGVLSAQVSAPSGIASIQFAIDGAVVNGGSLSGTQYSVMLDFNAIANGSHVFSLTATDTVGDVTTVTINVVVDIPTPAAPVITFPANGTTVRQATFNLSGTAALGSQVQIYNNGTAAGGLVAVGNNGEFSGSVNLAGEGTYTFTADARNSRGTSPVSAPVQLTYAVAAPTVVITNPATNATLGNAADFNVSVIDATHIDSVVLAIDGTPVATLTEPPYTYHWDISQSADGAHTLSAVATNALGKTGQDTRPVNVQKIPPPPPPVVTPYTGQVGSVSPSSSYGEQNIVITGSALNRSTSLAVANVPLKIVLEVSGFQRKTNAVTDSAGNFSFAYAPQTTDAGTYRVSVLHPDETVLTNQGQFVINRLNFSPSFLSINAAKGFAQPFQVNVSASAGQGASGVRFQLNPEDQPSGSVPAGISVDTGTAVDVPAGGSVPVTLNFTGTGAATSAGTVVVTAYAADSGSAKRGIVTLNYRLSDPVAALYPTPTYIQTGTSQGSAISETLTLENKGLVAATNVTLQLQAADGSTNVPSWIYLASTNTLGNLDVGKKQTVQITAAPDAGVVNAVYNFKLHVSADNASGGDIPISVSITQSGIGSVQFKVADIYTNTLDANSQPVPGVAGATIKIQNADVLTVQQNATTDASGSVTLANLATGSYTWRASALNHADSSGRFQIRPDATTTQNVFLDSNLVNVTFSVTPTTIVDHYDVTLTATYQTLVPAPVVLIEPLSINLPDMQAGQEYTGEISLTNYGLVRADNVVFTPPQSDASFKYEFYGTVPTSLDAKQRVTLAYKITSLQALLNTQSLQAPQGAASPGKAIKATTQASLQAAAAGTCNIYSKTIQATYDFDCANGDTRSGAASAVVSKVSGSTCGSGSGGWSGLAGWTSGWASPAPMALTQQCVPSCRGTCACAGGGSGSGGGGSDGSGP